MQSALRSALAALVLSAPIGVFGQDLPPGLAKQFTQGVETLKTGQLDRAEAFRNVLARDGDPALVHHNLGIVHQQRNHHAEARVDAARHVR